MRRAPSGEPLTLHSKPVTGSTLIQRVGPSSLLDSSLTVEIGLAIVREPGELNIRTDTSSGKLLGRARDLPEPSTLKPTRSQHWWVDTTV